MVSARPQAVYLYACWWQVLTIASFCACRPSSFPTHPTPPPSFPPPAQVRRILRRVTAPANKKEAKLTMKPLGRMLAKIMHATPLAVAEQLIRQVGKGWGGLGS